MSSRPISHLRQILAQNVGAVYRIAIGLVGNATTANKITRRVLHRSLTQARRWETDEDAARWFARFTVLCSRECGEVDSRRDPLVAVAPNSEAVELIYAIRDLPMQQREAFVLHHGQCMDLRQMATAMDCSATAASTHLTAATQALRKLSPAGLGPLTLNFPRMLDQVNIPPQQLQVQIQTAISRRRLGNFVRLFIAWPLILIGFAALSYAAFEFWKMLVF